MTQKTLSNSLNLRLKKELSHIQAFHLILLPGAAEPESQDSVASSSACNGAKSFSTPFMLINNTNPDLCLGKPTIACPLLHPPFSNIFFQYYKQNNTEPISFCPPSSSVHLNQIPTLYISSLFHDHFLKNKSTYGISSHLSSLLQNKLQNCIIVQRPHFWPFFLILQFILRPPLNTVFF